MIQTVTGQARNGISIAAHFNTSLGPAVSNKDAQRMPVNGTMCASSNISGHNRLKSPHERHRAHVWSNHARASSHNNVPIGMLPSNDLDHPAPPRTNKKCCSLCTQSDHPKLNWPCTNCYNKGPPLKHGDMECRLKLSLNLAVPNIFPTSFRPLGDKCFGLTTLPKMVKGIVIHECRFIQSGLQITTPLPICALSGPFLDLLAWYFQVTNNSCSICRQVNVSPLEAKCMY
jgi:hypothetical protein